MASVVHIVVTNGFAGVERHISDTASELAARDWEVTVIGGDRERMPRALGGDVSWLPGATPAAAARSLSRVGRQDVCHAHMTFAEVTSVVTRPLHHAPVVATRHFAASRGSTILARAISPLIASGISRELAISEFVARNLERRPDAVIHNGVHESPCLWEPSNRVVLVLQRLEAEKDTLTALRAWQEARLWEDGWSVRIAGEGRERQWLERWATRQILPAVEFAGWSDDVAGELRKAAVLLAPAPGEPLGLAVLEAMAAGVPVVAAGAGGHLETVGLLPDTRLFVPGDAIDAAAKLTSLRSAVARAEQSNAGRALVADDFLLARRVDDLEEQYAAIRRRGVRNQSASASASASAAEVEPSPLRELVVCSLEPWDEVWRRNQHIVDRLLRRNPELRVLFVEPPADPVFDVTEGRVPSLPSLRRVAHDGRLVALRPLKLLPRRFGPGVDASLREQVLLAARLIGFSGPALWINDVTYAPLIKRTGWSTVYDVTDDWLLAPFSVNERERIRRLDDLAVREADEVIVCSAALATSRGRHRSVTVIPNAVDVDHFRRPRDRPAELPDGPTAVYVGSLHDARLDVELVSDLARRDHQLNLVLVGPDSLSKRSHALLRERPNVFRLGPRPYEDIPGFLQHADVVIVPHRTTPFTESLDPVKAYECLAVGTPTIATDVPGFREERGCVRSVARDVFVEHVIAASLGPLNVETVDPPSWDERALAFERALTRVITSRLPDR